MYIFVIVLFFVKFENEKSILFGNSHLTMVKGFVCPTDFRGYMLECAFTCWKGISEEIDSVMKGQTQNNSDEPS